MLYTRLAAIALLIISVGCCASGIITGIAPLVTEVPLIDGTTAPPGLTLLGGLYVVTFAVMLLIASAVLWFVVVPRQLARSGRNRILDELRQIALQSYTDWLIAIRLQLPALGSQTPVYQTIRRRTLLLLPHLDPQNKRALIQLLYDTQLLTGALKLDLRGADLRGVDLRGVDLSGADLRETDLRGAMLLQARLNGTNFTGALITWEQLKHAASLAGAILPDTSIGR